MKDIISLTIFDRESQLNVLPYGSDEFSDKINEEIILRIISNTTADDTGLAEGVHGHPISCVAKIKKGNKGKKSFKAETIKRLSSR